MRGNHKDLKKFSRKSKAIPILLPKEGKQPHMNKITNRPKKGYRTAHEASKDAGKLYKRFGDKYATYKCNECRMYHLTTSF